MEKPPRARVRGCEKPRGAQRSAEKAGATEGIQWAGEGGSPLKLARARRDFQSHFSRSLLWKKSVLDMFWGSFRGVKKYSENKTFWVRTFNFTVDGGWLVPLDQHSRDKHPGSRPYQGCWKICCKVNFFFSIEKFYCKKMIEFLQRWFAIWLTNVFSVHCPSPITAASSRTVGPRIMTKL